MIEIPPEVGLALNVLIGFLVVEGIKVVFKKEIPELAKSITAVVVAAILSLFNIGLSYVPVEYQPLASQILTLLALVLGMFGLHRVYKSVRK